MNSSFGNACTFFPFQQVEAVAFLEKKINLSTVLGIPSSYFSNQRLKLKLSIGTMNSSFGNACTFFRFSKLRQLRFWKKTINLSTVLGIPSSYFSNQRLKLKLTIGTMNCSFGNACRFFRFCKLRQLRFWKKNKKSIHRSRNTFKLLFKSKIKVEINHWDHEFQFRECLQFLPFLQIEAVAFLEKKNKKSIHRSRNTFKLLFKSKIKVEINHWDHEFQFRECLQFLPFLQVEAVAFLEKNK